MHQRESALLACALLALATSAMAQTWPNRPLRIVVPFAPGGTTDLIARMVAEGLSRELGQPVVVENKAGAGGNLGAAEVARAAGGRLYADAGHARPAGDQRLVYANTGYNADKDFVAVSYVADVPNVVLANPSPG